MRKGIRFRSFDTLLFLAPIFIFMIGLLSIYSASYKTGQSFNESLALKQAAWVLVGALLIFLVIRYDYFILQDLAWPLYSLSLLLLVAVLFTPARLGAHRWISVAGFNFQPSELAKFSTILVLSHFFKNHRLEFISKRQFCIPFLVVAAPFLLILKEPDLGTGLLLIPVLLAMFYLWGLRGRWIAGLLLAGFSAAPFLFQGLKDYQKARLLVFLNPNADPLGAGYTIIQSKIAIGSGGLFGKGFMGGTQNYLNFLPERHTDFIFAVIAEEGGLLVSCLVIALFWLIVRKGFMISKDTPDRFGRFLACGFSTLIGTQAVVNLGMTMGLFPVVGIPLPLVSYGGTSVIMTMLTIGILINIKMRQPLF